MQEAHKNIYKQSEEIKSEIKLTGSILEHQIHKSLKECLFD